MALSLEGQAGRLSGGQEAGGGGSMQRGSRGDTWGWETGVPEPGRVICPVRLEGRMNVERSQRTKSSWRKVRPKKAVVSSEFLHSASCSIMSWSLWKTFLCT